jgi:hypothetical protein
VPPSPAHTKVHAVGFVGDFVSSTVSNEGVPVFFRCVPGLAGDTCAPHSALTPAPPPFARPPPSPAP